MVLTCSNAELQVLYSLLFCVKYSWLSVQHNNESVIITLCMIV